MLKIYLIPQMYIDEHMIAWMGMFASTIAANFMRCLSQTRCVVISCFVMIVGIHVRISCIVQNASSVRTVFDAQA